MKQTLKDYQFQLTICAGITLVATLNTAIHAASGPNSGPTVINFLTPIANWLGLLLMLMLKDKSRVHFYIASTIACTIFTVATSILIATTIRAKQPVPDQQIAMLGATMGGTMGNSLLALLERAFNRN